MQVAEFDVGSVASDILWHHMSGIAIMAAPKLFTRIGTEVLNLSTENSIYGGFAALSMFILAWFFAPKRLVNLLHTIFSRCTENILNAQSR